MLKIQTQKDHLAIKSIQKCKHFQQIRKSLFGKYTFFNKQPGF